MKRPSAPKKKGRPSKLTTQLAEQIITLIEAGNYVKDAVMACDVDEATYYRWMKKAEQDLAETPPRSNIYTELCKSAQCARAKARTYHVGLILKNAENGKDSRSSIEFLSRTDPDQWGRKDNYKLEHTGSGGGAIAVSLLSDEEVEKRAREILAKRQGN